jgi:DNA-binding NarL/FixJ family response regulator
VSGLDGLRLVLVDDHALVRAGMRALLVSLGAEVVAEAGDGVAALQVIGRLRPALVLLDVSMPGMSGLETARRIAKQHPRTRIVMLSMYGDSEYVRQAFVAGAVGYLLKSAERSELEMALTAVARGDVWLSPAISRSVLTQLLRGQVPPDPGASSIEHLTPRQREVLQLVVEGHSTKRIAQRLRISVKTVESHRAGIMERLDIHGVASLVRFAIRAGIVRLES